ncbi:MAG: hypothetical protein AAFX06_09220 [Planctomycetota bacterium]
MPEIHRTINFDAGIERILSHTDQSVPTLPDSANVAAGAGKYEQQLDEVLLPPSLEQSIVDSFRPEIKHFDLLNPIGYETALSECEEYLTENLELASDDAADRLRELRDLLSEEQKLRSLLRTYRHLLHKG